MLTQYIGDSKTHPIQLMWDGEPFVPTVDWFLTFTLKHKATDEDLSAICQKSSELGIIVAGSIANVTLIPVDTVELTPGMPIFDIVAKHLTTGDERTVAMDRLKLTQDVNRGSVPVLPIYSVTPPLEIGAPIISETEPDATSGFWFKPSTGTLYIYAEGAWVPISGGTGTVSPPVNTAAPVASGSPYDGGTVSVTTGTWTGSSITYAYQWQKNGADLIGQTTDTLAVSEAAADPGDLLTCDVTATISGAAPVTTSSNALTVTNPPAGVEWVPEGSASWDLPAGFQEEDADAVDILFMVNGIIHGIVPAEGIGTPLAYTFTGLANFTTYSIEILARNESGVSTPSYGEFEIKTAPAAAPSGLALEVISDTEITVTWTAGDGPTEIYRDDALLDTLAEGVATYEDADLSAATLYTYKLRSVSIQPGIYGTPQPSLFSPMSTGVSATTEEDAGIPSLGDPWAPSWDADGFSQWAVIDDDHLVLTATGISVPVAETSAADPFSGNVVMDCVVNLGADFNGLAALVLVFNLRATNIAPWEVDEGYGFTLNCASGVATFKLSKYLSGESTPIGPIGTTLSAADDYRVIFFTKDEGSDVHVGVRIQRTSDDKFLAPDGTWSDATTNAIDYTDSTSPITGTGTAGFAAYHSGGNVIDVSAITFNEAL